MNQNNISAIDGATDQQEIGLVSGLVDGVFTTVEFRGLLLHEVRGSVVVTKDGRQVGGRFKLAEDNFSGLLKWLDAKSELYGGSA